MLLTETPEAIIVLGRGIARGKQGWRPTRYFEKLNNRQHSGTFDVSLDPDDEDTVVAGAMANTLATFHLFKDLALQGYPPRLIIFAAGRPKYLENEPKTLSEGAILREQIFRRLTRNNIPLPETIILTNNKNTRDDIEESLRILADRGINRTSAITVELHQGRTAEFLRLALENAPEQGRPEIELLASENLLRSVDQRYRRLFEEAKKLPPYLRTEAMEQEGLARLKDGTYGQSSQGYTFARSQTV